MQQMARVASHSDLLLMQVMQCETSHAHNQHHSLQHAAQYSIAVWDTKTSRITRHVSHTKEIPDNNTGD